MSVLHQLASASDRRDELPNVELAKQIASKKDTAAVKELVGNLEHKDKHIQSDCIKVLYETGERNPALIAPYAKTFIALLQHKNNRLAWGAMTALDAMTSENPKAVYAALPEIMDAAGKGSVITRDHGVAILIKLCATKTYYENAFTLLLEQLKLCPTNQLPMYAENAFPLVQEKSKTVFASVLERRLDEIEKESKRKRVEKVIRKLR